MKKLGFGLMRLPLLNAGDPESVDQAELDKMVDYFLENGFTYFDTAYRYHHGMSELAIRKALVERYPRETFQFADKMPAFLVESSEDYQRYFDDQLIKCGVSYFDNYLLHSLGERNYARTLRHGGFDFMKKVKAEGKARRIGLSYHDKAQLLDRILTDHPEMEFVQLQINYIDWDSEAIESRKCYEVAKKHNKPVIVMEPVKGGALADVSEEAESLFKSYHPGMSAASWAVRFAASVEGVDIVLSGMSNFTQMQDNLSYMKDFQPLNEQEQAIVRQATELMNASTAIPCTACQYCVDDCPQNIPIPSYFSLYNNQHRFSFVPAHANYYNNLTQTHGKATECIECGKCEENCPQHIDVIAQMKEVARVFEG